MKSFNHTVRRRAFGGALLFALLALTTHANAQSSNAVDRQGNLTAMPFEPDYPVSRTTVVQDGNMVAFVTYTPMDYDDVITHYRQHYVRQTELAPGWRLLGHGFNAGTQAYTFTLNHANQRFSLEVVPDEVTGGTVVTVRGRGFSLGYRPHAHDVAPYRATDVGPVQYRDR